MKFEISGTVNEKETGARIPGVVVVASDKDRFWDDRLGEVLSDAAGQFHLVYDDKAFRDVFEKAPDVYLTVKTPAGEPLYSTKDAVRFDAGHNEVFQLDIPAEVLHDAGMSTAAPPATVSTALLTTLTCLDGADSKDELVRAIRGDLAGKSSLLELMKDYLGELAGTVENDALALRKLRKLFALGRVPDRVEGHHYGVTLGLRTGDLQGLAAEYGNLLGYLWGLAIGRTCPWVGKSFVPMAARDRQQVTGQFIAGDVPVFRGINHFNVIEHAPINLAANAVLAFLWQLGDAPETERLRYGHERNGGHFVAHRAPSVYAGTAREVFRLNYRFTTLGNPPPLIYLIDELVEIADGMYLGQLLFSTARMFDRYDPLAPDASYHYQHFGYFLLVDEAWNAEAKRLFPHLEMPAAAVTLGLPASATTAPVAATPAKFTTLTLADPADGNVNPALLAAVRKDLADSGSVLRMLKSYSDALMRDKTNESPIFAKLHSLFNAGIGPEIMTGYYPGALVSWRSEGILGAFDVNNINLAWKATRAFSPWTGKRFDPIDKARLAELTDGREIGKVPTFLCANTVVFRTARERMTRTLMNAVDLWIEDASPEERKLCGYDAKTFFFVGKPAASIAADNHGKRVFQLNYRWKKLRNPPPDCLCIDEIAQIASGLYLGQVFYAGEITLPWDPAIDPARYRYGLYEYFVLMDQEWQAERLRIGFDLDNA
jgi:hypothetical protein